MFLNMSHPPTILSHGGLPASHQPYPTPPRPFSRPESIPPSNNYHSRELSENQSNTQRLPSLRTLLEPQLLDKPSDHSIRQAAPQHSQNASLQYGSSSPALKRRHDFDSHAHVIFERNATAPQMSYAHRPSPSHVHTEQQSAAPSTLCSTFSTGSLDQHRHGSCNQPSYDNTAGSTFRQTSTASESITTLPIHTAFEDVEDPSRPVRRRIDALSCAPIRASRCIAQREMPGEGLCYIYEDGSYCRAIIDGEPVNPSWGITKAGKPRKRLAQACLTCREKKIKCEPGSPKCHQCAKAQRVCRGGLNQPNQPGTRNGSTEVSPSAPTAAPLGSYVSESMSPSVSSEKVNSIVKLRENLRTADARYSGATLKCQDHLPPPALAAARDPSVHSYDSDWSSPANPREHHDSSAGLYQDHLALQWEQDPSEMDPKMTLSLLDLYFLHAGRATYGMFPRKAFVSWAQFGRRKSQDDRMLLYSILAMGSLFSPDADKRALGKRFAGVAIYAAEKRFGKFSLQLCQSRLLLALYCFAQGKSQEAWDFCGAGLRASSALKLNTEEGVKALADGAPELEYGFDRRTFDECCRRTFWSGFLMDRYNGFFGGTFFVVSLEDAFVHLPCMEAMYENGTPNDTALFDFELLNRFAPKTPVLGHMAYLCLISALWGDVLTFTGRAARRPDAGYEQHYESFYAKTYERLEGWLAILPANLRYSPQNLENSIAEGYDGTFMSIHALYYSTIIRLNRQIRLTAMPADKISRNVEHAIRNAHKFLTMMHNLALINRQRRNSTLEHSFSTPFPGYALMLSIDVVSSAGKFADLPSLIDTIGTATSCIEELSAFWASARAQQKSITYRLKQLTDIAVEQTHGTSHVGQFWNIGESLDVASFGKNDALYNVRELELFKVVDRLALPGILNCRKR